MKEKQRKKKIAYICFTAVVVLLIAAIAITYYVNYKAKSVDGSGVDTANYQTLTYKGKTYTYNSKATVVLYAGVHSKGELKTYNRYTIGPVADSIQVVVMDGYSKKVKVLGLSRDAIVKIGRYTMNGNRRNSYKSQLGYAYSYGNSGKTSCDNLVSAVSNVLNGVPIQEYVITNRTSIKKINDLCGGVTVTVPNNDLASKYPELTEGSTVTLSDSTVEPFVRYRDTSERYTNNGRMERQRAFIDSFMNTFKSEVAKDPDKVWDKIDEVSPYMITSITKSQYLKMADKLDECNWEDANYYTIEGTNSLYYNKHDAYHMDKDSLMETIIDLFYIEDGEA